MLEDKLNDTKKMEEAGGDYREGNVIYPKKFNGNKKTDYTPAAIKAMQTILGYSILYGSLYLIFYNLLQK